MRKSTWMNRIPCMTPATPASSAPMANVMTMIRSVSIPMRRAVSGSCDVARIALPVRLVRMNVCRPSIRVMATTTRKRLVRATAIPAPSSMFAPSMMRGNDDLALAARIEEAHELLQEDRHADGGDQGREPRCVAEGPVGEALDERGR